MTSLTIVRLIKATPRAMFDAFILPEKIALWWGPDAGPVLSAEVEPREGGRFHVRFRTEDGEEHGSSGVFETFEPRGPVTFRPADVRVRAGRDLAFATCTVHCDGTTAGPIDFRLTTGLERRGGDWTITHEHHSMPTKDEVLIGPDAR